MYGARSSSASRSGAHGGSAGGSSSVASMGPTVTMQRGRSVRGVQVQRARGELDANIDTFIDAQKRLLKWEEKNASLASDLANSNGGSNKARPSVRFAPGSTLPRERADYSGSDYNSDTDGGGGSDADAAWGAADPDLASPAPRGRSRPTSASGGNGAWRDVRVVSEQTPLGYFDARAAASAPLPAPLRTAVTDVSGIFPPTLNVSANPHATAAGNTAVVGGAVVGGAPLEAAAEAANAALADSVLSRSQVLPLRRETQRLLRANAALHARLVAEAERRDAAERDAAQRLRAMAAAHADLKFLHGQKARRVEELEAKVDALHRRARDAAATTAASNAAAASGAAGPASGARELFDLRSTLPPAASAAAPVSVSAAALSAADPASAAAAAAAASESRAVAVLKTAQGRIEALTQEAAALRGAAAGFAAREEGYRARLALQQAELDRLGGLVAAHVNWDKVQCDFELAANAKTIRKMTAQLDFLNAERVRTERVLTGLAPAAAAAALRSPDRPAASGAGGAVSSNSALAARGLPMRSTTASSSAGSSGGSGSSSSSSSSSSKRDAGANERRLTAQVAALRHEATTLRAAVAARDRKAARALSLLAAAQSGASAGADALQREANELAAAVEALETENAALAARAEAAEAQAADAVEAVEAARAGEEETEARATAAEAAAAYAITASARAASNSISDDDEPAAGDANSSFSGVPLGSLSRAQLRARVAALSAREAAAREEVATLRGQLERGYVAYEGLAAECDSLTQELGLERSRTATALNSTSPALQLSSAGGNVSGGGESAEVRAATAERAAAAARAQVQQLVSALEALEGQTREVEAREVSVVGLLRRRVDELATENARLSHNNTLNGSVAADGEPAGAGAATAARAAEALRDENAALRSALLGAQASEAGLQDALRSAEARAAAAAAAAEAAGGAAEAAAAARGEAAVRASFVAAAAAGASAAEGLAREELLQRVRTLEADLTAVVEGNQAVATRLAAAAAALQEERAARSGLEEAVVAMEHREQQLRVDLGELAEVHQAVCQENDALRSMSGAHVSTAATLQQQASAHRAQADQAVQLATAEASERARAHEELAEAEAQLTDMASKLADTQARLAESSRAATSLREELALARQLGSTTEASRRDAAQRLAAVEGAHLAARVKAEQEAVARRHAEALLEQERQVAADLRLVAASLRKDLCAAERAP